MAEAHASLATIKQLQWDWATAEKEYARALELNPNYATAHQWYSLYLAAAGRREEALLALKRAQQLDPASLVIALSLAGAVCESEYDRGIKSLMVASEMDPGAAAPHWLIAECHARWDRLEDALAEVQKAEQLEPGLADSLSGLGYIYARLGRRAEATALLEQLKEKDLTKDMSGQIATVYAGLGEKEEVFRWLEKSYQRRSPFFINDLRYAFTYDPFRSDPGFPSSSAASASRAKLSIYRRPLLWHEPRSIRVVKPASKGGFHESAIAWGRDRGIALVTRWSG